MLCACHNFAVKGVCFGMVAIVLAAGNGRKMFPFDLTRQKCAIPIANEPIVRRLVRQLKIAGIEQFVVVTGHNPGQVREAILRDS